MKRVLMLVSLLMPWPLRRRLLCAMLGYKIDPTARIGLAWILPGKLVMERNSKIGHLTVVKGLDLLHLKEQASVGRANWITGFPSASKEHFAHQDDRQPSLIMGEHSAITHRHLIDCTDRISIGQFTILAGFRSQILTHSVDLKECRQSCAPVSIGNFCFIGTDCVILGGTSLPDYSVLGAKSLLNYTYTETYQLYAGVPARPVKSLDRSDKFFSRQEGFLW